jgi:hypothetical protein
MQSNNEIVLKSYVFMKKTPFALFFSFDLFTRAEQTESRFSFGGTKVCI